MRDLHEIMPKQPAEPATGNFWESPLEPVYHNIRKNLKGHPHADFIEIYLGLAVIIVFLLFASLAPYIGEKLGLFSLRKDKQQSFAQEDGVKILTDQFLAEFNNYQEVLLLPDDEENSQEEPQKSESTPTSDQDSNGMEATQSVQISPSPASEPNLEATAESQVQGLKLKTGKKQLKEDIEKNLLEISRQRKDKLLALIDKNPAKVLEHKIPKEVRDQLPEEIKVNIEEEVDLTGTLEVLIEDDFENNRSHDRRFLNVNNQRFSLHTSDQFPQFLSSSKVRVTGVKLDEKIAFTTKNTLEILEEATPDSIGDQRTVVILANFVDTSPNSKRNNISPDGVRDAVFTKTNNYYVENSYNKISLTGGVFGWYELPIKTTICDDLTAVLNAAIVTADPDVFYPDYNRLILVFPSRSCGIPRGTLGLWSILTPDGTVLMSVTWMNSDHVGLPTIGHEFGHNLGNHHASFLNCGDVPIASSGCTNIEYGDPYDILGRSTPVGHFNAPHKEYVGWFDASNIQTVTTSGTYTIEPIETATSGLKALKIQRDISDYLYLEYRQPIGYDANFQSFITGSDVFDGVLLHTVERGIYYPYLIDATPPGDSTTPALKLDDIFTDPATGTTVTVTDRTGASLTVDVVIGTLDSDGDGFTNVLELYLGTDFTKACPQTSTAKDEEPDAWPPDFDDNRKVDMLDVLALKQHFNTKEGDANYSRRYDLDTNGSIELLDVNILKQSFNQTCTP